MPAQVARRPTALSVREFDAVMFAHQDLPTKEIAYAMNTTFHAVVQLHRSARKKLGVRTRIGMALAFERGQVVMVRTVPDIALPSHEAPSGESFTSFENRQRSAEYSRPSPVVGRAVDAQSQDGMTTAAEPIQHGAQPPPRAAAPPVPVAVGTGGADRSSPRSAPQISRRA